MKKKLPCLPMAVVQQKVEELEEKHSLDLGLEPHGAWLWLTTTDQIKPLHWEKDKGYVKQPGDKKGCGCAECIRRASIRHELGDMGFVYCKGGHKMPTGSTGIYGNHCDKPIPFFRKGKGKRSSVPGVPTIDVTTSTTATSTQPKPDTKDELADMLADLGV